MVGRSFAPRSTPPLRGSRRVWMSGDIARFACSDVTVVDDSRLANSHWFSFRCASPMVGKLRSRSIVCIARGVWWCELHGQCPAPITTYRPDALVFARRWSVLVRNVVISKAAVNAVSEACVLYVFTVRFLLRWPKRRTAS